MKKVVLFLITIIICLVNTGCSDKGYTEISYKKLMNKVENKESFPLFVGATSCSHCKVYKGILEEFYKKYKVEIFYLDVDKLSKDEYNKFKLDFNFPESTPTTMIIQNGQSPSTFDMFTGADYNDLISLLKRYEYIK